MAQIIHTVVNKESIVALNDTATLFDTESKYNSIFHNKADYDIYKFSAMLYKKIWAMKNLDIRANQYEPEIRDLVSKGGFVLLHIMSSLMLSDAEFVEAGKSKKEIYIKNINISTPSRKNEFTKRKKSLFSMLENDEKMASVYNVAKTILITASQKYSSDTDKQQNSLFKQRSFDRDYLKPAIEKHLTAVIEYDQPSI